MYDVKETSCSRCVHKDVCLYKEQFLTAQRTVNEVTVAIPATDENGAGVTKIRDISWIESIELKCKHFYQRTGTIRGGNP